MIKNPYEILGIKKTSDSKEIKSAYRKLAKQYHPDLNPGNKQAEDKFKDISTAYELLHNKEKRAAYDRGEIDMDSNLQQRQKSYKDYAEKPQGQRYYSSSQGGGYNQDDISDIFGSFFSGNTKSASFRTPPADSHYTIEIEFLEATKGIKKRITMPDGKMIDLSIPEGMEDGQQLRLKGKGHPGNASIPPGDAYIKIHIKPHSFYRRKGKDIEVEVPIGIHESILGSKINISTIHGKVKMGIPKGSSTGTKVRLKGQGIRGGDQYVRLKIVMPEIIDDKLEKFTEEWAKTYCYNPRKSMGSAL